MRNLLKGAFYMMLAIALISCSDDEEYVEPILDVTPNNIAGEWCLESWNDAPLAEGSYVYISFERADRTYTLYQNVDSAPARTLTGRYYITTDMELGAVIRGDYDFGVGEWAHRYVVKDLTAKSMTWIAKDNPDDVSVYVRCEIPEQVK
ncbi:MAG: lipocalin family protein [Alistipes sp.]|nr:lipocalin family protein [Alistipes sp.]MBO5332431.1 lipocalin family protein [Alistipes sp.]